MNRGQIHHDLSLCLLRESADPFFHPGTPFIKGVAIHRQLEVLVEQSGG